MGLSKSTVYLVVLSVRVPCSLRITSKNIYGTRPERITALIIEYRVVGG